jgi:hypothetical protein
MLVCLSWDQIDRVKYLGVLHGKGVPLALDIGLALTPRAAPDGLIGVELERQIFRRERAEKVRRIERLARRKSTGAASSSVENPIDGFDDEWRGEGIDIASLRDRPAGPASLPDNNIDQEGLRRSSTFVGGDRWRGGGIAKIAKWRVVEVTAKAHYSHVAGDDRNF